MISGQRRMIVLGVWGPEILLWCVQFCARRTEKEEGYTELGMALDKELATGQVRAQ